MSRFGSKRVVTGLKEEQKDNIERTALKRLENGGIICFDDFERKSRDIDLNDLFGFITQLTLNFECKIVVILNNDVFEAEEKNVFVNVKEKTVSKFLYYNPSIEELFSMIFSRHNLYKDWNKLENDICKYIKETNTLNARIYNQILDNLNEWLLFTDKEYRKQEVLRCLIQVNIYYILYHTSFYRTDKNVYKIKGFNDKLDEHSNSFNSVKHFVSSFHSSEKREFKFIETFELYLNELEEMILTGENLDGYKDFFIDNKSHYKSKYYANYLDIGKKVNDETFNKITSFIETGILED